MGVVYKFRKEVMDFVLQQKRTEPDFGCRQLAALTSEKFKIQVSKSSVNAIIKNANLSNAVGRPVSAEPVPKKFQIPSQKKQQLLAEVQKVKLEPNALPPKALPQLPKAPDLAKPRKEPGLSLPGKAPAIEAQKRGFSPATFSRHVESLRVRRALDKGIPRQGMGCVFLKAAQWQLSKSSLLGGLFRKYIPGPLPPQFDAFCDVLPCLNLLGALDPDQMERFADHALWDFNGFEQPLRAPEISRWSNAVQAVPPSVKFSLEYEKEKRQALMAAKRFEFYLENGGRITTDVCLAGLGQEKFSACLEQAMAVLSHCVISNNQPAIFLSSAGRLPLGGGRRFPREVLDMVAAFEGMEGKRFKKAVVFDGAGERVAEFSSFPREKRFFMLGVWPWQEEFLLLSTAPKIAEPFYDDVTDKIFYVAAGPAPIFQEELELKRAPLRSITVFASLEESAPAMAILTNCADKAPADIVQAFLRRWPNLDAGPAGRAINAAAEAGSALPDDQVVPCLAGQSPFLVFPDWGSILDQYCRKYFFGKGFVDLDVTSLISACYSLPGYCMPQDQVWLVTLCVPGAYSYLNELQLAVERANEANITDPPGRKVFINILK